MRRSQLLKIASILMMLTSLVRFFFGFMMVNLYINGRNMGTVERSTLHIAGAAFGLIFLCAIAELIAGFVGALNWEEPLRAGRCVTWGAVSLVLGLAGNITQAFTGYGISIVAWTTGCIVPLLFTAAALHFLLGSRRDGRTR